MKTPFCGKGDCVWPWPAQELPDLKIEEIPGDSKYYGYYSNGSESGMEPFKSIEALYEWWHACKSPVRVMLKNIAVKVTIQEAKDEE